MKQILYLVVFSALVLVSCASQNDKDYFDAAQKSMESKDYATALVNFQHIVDNFPNSEHYKFALLQTGELNHGLVNKELSKEASLTQAIIAYKLYQEKYPNETKAPQTLFMVGFIQANELGQLDEAKATYTKFIELYPESDMVESAKSEIETIGLSPDEILKNKTIK